MLFITPGIAHSFVSRRSMPTNFKIGLPDTLSMFILFVCGSLDHLDKANFNN